MDERVLNIIEKMTSRYFHNLSERYNPAFFHELTKEITRMIYENYKTVQGIVSLIELDNVIKNLDCYKEWTEEIK